jgi:prefoldin subunit 5
LYHYNGNEVGDRFQGKTISGKNVEKAREALKIYLTEMDEFQSKILATKRDSAEAYNKMIEDLDNLKGNKESTKCIRSWSRVSTSMVSNYNLQQAQSDIKANMEKVQNEMKKLAEAQGEILKALKSRSDSSPTRRSTLHPRKSTYY